MLDWLFFGLDKKSVYRFPPLSAWGDAQVFSFSFTIFFSFFCLISSIYIIFGDSIFCSCCSGVLLFTDLVCADKIADFVSSELMLLFSIFGSPIKIDSLFLSFKSMFWWKSSLVEDLWFAKLGWFMPGEGVYCRTLSEVRLIGEYF